MKAAVKPNGRPLDDVEVQKLIADGADATILPKSVGDAELSHRAGSGFSDQTRSALKTVNKPIQVFKTGATVLNIPFYHERNFMDDSWRAWSSGATASSYNDAVRLVKDQSLFERRQQTMLDPAPISGEVMVAGKMMPRSQFLREAGEDGALRTGFFAGEDLLAASPKPATGLRRIRPVGKIREWGQNAEDVPKLAAYKAARDRGLSRAEASAHMRVYMFDYDELTDAERAIRGLAIPFYTYMKKNTALQARLFVTRPGKLSAIEKIREAANEYGSDSDEYKRRVAKVMPLLEQARDQGLITQGEIDAMRRGHFEALLNENDQRAMPTLGPGGKLVYMPLGVTDLQRIPFATSWEAFKRLPKQQFDLAMQMVGPQKLPIEMAQNYSFFFRDAIYRSAKTPDADRWVTAPGWAQKAGIPTVKREVDGKTVDAWPAWVDYSIRSLGPQLGMLANAGNPTQNSRGQSSKDMLRKQLTGVRTADFDSRLLAGVAFRAAERLGKVQVAIADMNDPGAKGKADPSHSLFFSRKYQSLQDDQKALIGLMAAVKEALTGLKPVAAKRLTRRPLSIEEQTRKKIEASMGANTEEKIRERVARQIQKYDLMARP